MSKDTKMLHSISDLFDFFEAWRALRPEMEALSDSRRLDAREREILAWLINVADRVGPEDLDPRDPQEEHSVHF